MISVQGCGGGDDLFDESCRPTILNICLTISLRDKFYGRDDKNGTEDVENPVEVMQELSPDQNEECAKNDSTKHSVEQTRC